MNLKIRNRPEMWDSQIEYPVRLSPFFKDPKDFSKVDLKFDSGVIAPNEVIEHINNCQIQNESEETRID